MVDVPPPWDEVSDKNTVNVHSSVLIATVNELSSRLPSLCLIEAGLTVLYY